MKHFPASLFPAASGLKIRPTDYPSAAVRFDAGLVYNCWVFVELIQLFQMDYYYMEVKLEDQPQVSLSNRQPQTISAPSSKELRDNCAERTKIGHWSEKEQAKYYAFLTRYEDKFSVKESRRQWKVFKSLASFIKSRNANQCRSHHHKMTKNFNSIQQTLDYLRKKYSDIQEKCQKYLHQLRSPKHRQSRESSVEENKEPQHNIEGGYQPLLDNNYDQLKESKYFDIGNLKTDTIYNGGFEYKPMDLLMNSCPPPPAASYKGFPTTGLINTSVNLLEPYLPTYSDFASVECEYFQNPYMVDPGLRNAGNEQEWAECHEYFLKWVNKLSSLMENS